MPERGKTCPNCDPTIPRGSLICMRCAVEIAYAEGRRDERDGREGQAAYRFDPATYNRKDPW